MRQAGTMNMRDFDICFPDRHYEALEIGAFTDSAAEAHMSARAGKDVLYSDLLARSWLVAVPASAKVKGLLAGAEGVLRILERWGREAFLQGDEWQLRWEFGERHQLIAAAETLIALDVVHAASRIPEAGEAPTVVLVTRSVDGRWIGRLRTALSKLSAAEATTSRSSERPLRRLEDNCLCPCVMAW